MGAQECYQEKDWQVCVDPRQRAGGQDLAADASPGGPVKSARVGASAAKDDRGSEQKENLTASRPGKLAAALSSMTMPSRLMPASSARIWADPISTVLTPMLRARS